LRRACHGAAAFFLLASPKPSEGTSMKVLSVCAAALTLALAPAAFAQKAADDPVAAVVNGEKIYRSEVTMVLDALPEQYKQVPVAAIYPQIVQRLVDRKLLAQAAKKAGYLDKPDVKRRIALQQEQVLQEAYLYAKVDESLTDARLKAAYDKKVAGATKEEEVRARHILLKTEGEAKAVIAELEKGADFAKLASEKSVGPTKSNGGDLGYFKRDQMVAPFAEAAFKLKKGEYTHTPVQTQFGWHVILVEDRRAAKVPSFEESKDELKDEEARAVIGDIMAKVREGAEITVLPADAQPAPGGIVPLR
jgi:peptidyl-prolyl cis-trans isomerase C